MFRIFPILAPYHQGNTTSTFTKCRIVTVAGTSRTCKTSVLFQAAISAAAEGCHVTYITQEPMKRLPLHVHGMPTPDPATLKQLKILYMREARELVSYLSGIHQVSVPPEILIVDNLHVYCEQLQGERSAEQAIAKLCALLQDSINFLAHKSVKCDSIQLLVSTQDISPGHLCIYHKFLKNIYQVKKHKNPSPEERFEISTFTPTAHGQHSSENITFSKRKDGIFLEETLIKKQKIIS